MSDIRIAQSWDSLPPVVYDGDEAISTRKLEKDYRDAMDRIEELENPWISVDDEPFPILGGFWATWVIDGEMDGLECYSWGGEPGVFWNLNSSNIYRLGQNEKQMAMFTHWMKPISPLPPPPEAA